MDIGVQMMMVKQQVAEEGMFAVLQRISELGYRHVEISQIPMDDATTADLERGTGELDVRVASLSVALTKPEWGGIDDLDTQFDKVVADCRRLACTFTRIGMMPFQAMTSLEACEQWATDAERAAQKLAAEGITLCYHNHHVDLARFGDEKIFDIVRRVAPTLHFEVDLHWVQRGGMNPIDMLKQYSGVTDLIHLKDYRVTPVSESAIDLLTEGKRDEFMRAFSGGIIQFAEVGQGTMNWPEIIPAALAAGAKYFFVEQDDTYGRDPFDCLADSRQFLSSIGY